MAEQSASEMDVRYGGGWHPQQGQFACVPSSEKTHTSGARQYPTWTQLPSGFALHVCDGSTQPQSRNDALSASAKPLQTRLPGQTRPPHCGKTFGSHGVAPTGKQAHVGSDVPGAENKLMYA